MNFRCQKKKTPPFKSNAVFLLLYCSRQAVRAAVKVSVKRKQHQWPTRRTVKEVVAPYFHRSTGATTARGSQEDSDRAEGGHLTCPHRYQDNNWQWFKSINVLFYVCSHQGDIRQQQKQQQKYYTNLPTGLWKINLTTELKISVLYKIFLMQALKSYPFFLNNSVVIGHSSKQTRYFYKRMSLSVNT